MLLVCPSCPLIGIRCLLFRSVLNFFLIFNSCCVGCWANFGEFGLENKNFDVWVETGAKCDSACVCGVNGFTMCLRNCLLLSELGSNPCVKSSGSRLSPIRPNPLEVIFILPILAFSSLFFCKLKKVLDVS